ncbi:MAG: nitrous oxide reductase accessory protein NosL [Flavobacteriaceae bacterium]|nr:nitrous oxide reductase accessory protein NosL [Flavobacteriaceae bacterium]
MMKPSGLFYVIFLFSFLACQQQPQAIDYGHDACDFCRMTIVDKTHSAQLVTPKGKQYKYDAIECMLNDLKQGKLETQILQVANYQNAGEMIDAQQAHYLISPHIQSPMGENLSALKTEVDAQQLQNEVSGDTYSWEDLLVKFNAK